MCEYGESFIPLSIWCGSGRYASWLLDLVQKRKNFYLIPNSEVGAYCWSLHRSSMLYSFTVACRNLF